MTCCGRKNTHTLIHTLARTHTHSLYLSLSRSLSLSLCHTHSLTNSLSHSHTHTRTGMAASSVPIRREVPDLREELTQAGVRFIYFSSRNMRRSKPVAEKIGLQFDWNVRTVYSSPLFCPSLLLSSFHCFSSLSSALTFSLCPLLIFPLLLSSLPLLCASAIDFSLLIPSPLLFPFFLYLSLLFSLFVVSYPHSLSFFSTIVCDIPQSIGRGNKKRSTQIHFSIC